MRYFFLFTLFILIPVVIFPAQFLERYAQLFDVSEPLSKTDAILILGGNPETRVEHAVGLYRQKVAPLILYTSPRAKGHKYHDLLLPQIEKVRRALASEKDVVFAPVPSLSGGATSTFDEAYDLAAYLKSRPDIRRLAVVTDSYHTARARYALNKILEKEGIRIQIRMAGAPNRYFDAGNWWRNEEGLLAYMFEPLKFLFYLLNDRNTTVVEAV